MLAFEVGSLRAIRALTSDLSLTILSEPIGLIDDVMSDVPLSIGYSVLWIHDANVLWRPTGETRRIDICQTRVFISEAAFARGVVIAEPEVSFVRLLIGDEWDSFEDDYVMGVAGRYGTMEVALRGLKPKVSELLLEPGEYVAYASTRVPVSKRFEVPPGTHDLGAVTLSPGQRPSS
jgi:hypothetical protein